MNIVFYLPNMRLMLLFVTAAMAANKQVFPCDSEIYCKGPLLDAAQNAFIFNDSKSFVDMKLNYPPEVVLSAFRQLNLTHNGNIPAQVVTQFVLKNFENPGSEFENWLPEDWTESPCFLAKIADENLRSWASDLNQLWKVLGRKMVNDVFTNSSQYSIIPVKNPVIVPGGRFREFYYWDSYWVVRGLILSEMHSTVKGMLQNFLQIVEDFGFVPNGGRIYYTRRSQPPFLIAMVKDYFESTGDIGFLKLALPILEKEYKFWVSHRSIQVNGYTLNYYGSEVNQPRPESYREDKNAIKNLNPDDARTLMGHLTSACESGWDFSSRWAGTEYSEKTNVLQQLVTRNVLPVDLNSIMALNERTMAEFYTTIGNLTEADKYTENYSKRVMAIEALMWDENDGSYYDYVLSDNSPNKKYFASNANPLWTKCFPSNIDVTERENRIYQYLKKTGVLDYPGGIPTSLSTSGEQWDFPNAWPPLVHMIIEGLASSNSTTLQSEALQQARKWISGNYRAYVKTNFMFEKYDVTVEDGVAGSGGEYDVQVGFGWTNGVVMSLLDRYGDILTVDTAPTTGEGLTVTTPEMTTGSSNALKPAMLLFVCLLILVIL